MHVFLCYFALSFLFSFYSFVSDQKRQKKLVLIDKQMISTNKRHAEHRFAGQNTRLGETSFKIYEASIWQACAKFCNIFLNCVKCAKIQNYCEAQLPCNGSPSWNSPCRKYWRLNPICFRLQSKSTLKAIFGPIQFNFYVLNQIFQFLDRFKDCNL